MGQNDTVPFMDLSAQHRILRDDIEAAISRTIETSQFVLGEQTAEFESAFAGYCGCEFAIGVSSGTAALHLSLLAADVGPGDEVVTVPNTFVATVEAIHYTGATPVLVDVDPETFTLDPAAFERAITPKTRAVIPVHMYGQPCDIESVCAIADENGIRVIEDACQAHGARMRDRRVGTFGAAASFSFYPTKNLGAIGDGGAVTTNDPEMARRVRALRHHGQFQPNEFARVGYNYRLDSLQAGVLATKLPHLDGWNERRREIARRVRDGVTSSEFRFQIQVPGSEPVFHILAVRHKRQKAVQELLSSAGIGWGRHIMAPIHHQKGYRELDPGDGSLAVSEALSLELVSLPVWPELSDSQVDRVVAVLGKVEVSV
jgi:dTDP-4-amino-4,6-dideoxygalactose transaminase